ncbi:2-aminoethylphosphonate--pyruvate transaminase, partial [Paenibacillus glucanolyticus]
MNKYKLLTPGPLTTTSSVKEEMLLDRCTWDDEYKSITQKIRSQLLALAGADAAQYTAVLMQGSGTFAVESVMTSTISKEDKVLIVTNGAYGERLVKMA